MRNFLFLTLIFYSCLTKRAEHLDLPAIFSDGMVLQQQSEVSIWGTTNPNQLVEIESSWGVERSTTSNENGKWIIKLETNKNSNPQELIIKSGKKLKKISDVLLGEVWLASGQSNMEMNFDYCCNTTDRSALELATANYPLIRMFNVKKNLSLTPTEEISGNWVKANGNDISSFSAVGYFFAKTLHQDLNVPVGIIHSSWGGSNLESWTSNNVLDLTGLYDDQLNGLNQLGEKTQIANEWFTKFRSVDLPSGDFDLFLGESLSKKRPEIDYLSFHLDNWKKLDHIGVDRIMNKNDDEFWATLTKETFFGEESKRPDFKGVILFKNHFIVNDDKEIISLEITPDKNFSWGLWEYDIYINKKKIASSLMEKPKEDYKFTKSLKKFIIEPSLLKSEKNEIIIRIFGYPFLGHINIISKNKNPVDFENEWAYSIIAEEYSQTENYIYPYTALYLYENGNFDYLDAPEKKAISHVTSGALFNAMLYPLIPYKIKGMIWYQGETNIGVGGPEYLNYKTLMPLMIKDLRDRWGSNFPFYFAQIAPYFNYNGMSPYFRDVQRKLLNIENTGMVVTLDIGENYDIHPSNKHDVGKRFASLALFNQYEKEVIYSGPTIKSAELKDGIVVVKFSNHGSGLKLTKHGKSEFQLAGKDKVFMSAIAINQGEFLEIFSKEVITPTYLRYAFSDTSRATLFNLEGFPASSFEIKIY